MTIDESKWINDIHGMELEPFDDFMGQRHNENGILFLVQYYLLKDALGRLTDGDRNRFYKICTDLRSYKRDGTDRYKGLFDRGKEESKLASNRPNIRTISHDNVTAISRFSILKNLLFNKFIAEHLIDSKMTMDNVQPWKPRLLYKRPNGKWSSRIQHPRDWHYWLYNGGYEVLSLPFYPIFALANIVTCRTAKAETSGKLLMFTRLFNRKEWHYRILWKICSKMLTKKYGKNWLSAITAIYYHQREDNPIRVLAAEVEQKGLL